MSGLKVIVVGASSGLGAELTRLLVVRGDTVAALARRTDRLEELRQDLGERLLPIAHDVTDFDTVPSLFQDVCHQLGGLDLIIYCAGVMPDVGPTEFSFAKDQSMIDVNVTGAVAWLNEAATRFQNTKHGTIVGIGSVAGERGRQGQPVYNMSKAALKSYMESLRNRLSKYGVKVVTIKPGPIATEMTAHLSIKGAMSAHDAAQLIIKKMNRGNEHYLKFAHKIAFMIIRNFPSGIFRRLKV